MICKHDRFAGVQEVSLDASKIAKVLLQVITVTTLQLQLFVHLLLEYDELRLRRLRLLSLGRLSSLLALRGGVLRRGLRLLLRLRRVSRSGTGEGERSARPFSRVSLGSLASLSDISACFVFLKPDTEASLPYACLLKRLKSQLVKEPKGLKWKDEQGPAG